MRTDCPGVAVHINHNTLNLVKVQQEIISCLELRTWQMYGKLRGWDCTDR